MLFFTRAKYSFWLILFLFLLYPLLKNDFSFSYLKENVFFYIMELVFILSLRLYFQTVIIRKKDIVITKKFNDYIKVKYDDIEQVSIEVNGKKYNNKVILLNVRYVGEIRIQPFINKLFIKIIIGKIGIEKVKTK